MSKGTRIPESVKDDIRRDYYSHDLTVSEIAAKHNVNRRRVYDYVKADRYGANAVKAKRKAAYISKDDAELILLLICECAPVLKGKYAVLAKCLEERMLAFADDLTF